MRRREADTKKTTASLGDEEELQLTLREIPTANDTSEQKTEKPGIETAEQKSPKLQDLSSGEDITQAKVPAPPGGEERSLGSGDEKKTMEDGKLDSQIEGVRIKLDEEKRMEDVPDGRTNMAAGEGKVKQTSELTADDRVKTDVEIKMADIPIKKADVQIKMTDEQIKKQNEQIKKLDEQKKSDERTKKIAVPLKKPDAQLPKTDLRAKPAENQVKDMKEVEEKRSKMAEQEVEESHNATAKVEGIPVHPHVHLTNELLQPIKAEPVTPKKEEMVCHLNIQFNIHLNIQFNIHLNLQFNIYLNIQFNIHLNIQFNIQSNIQFNIHLNIQFNIHLNIQFNIQFNIHLNVQFNIDLNIQFIDRFSIQFNINIEYLD